MIEVRCDSAPLLAVSFKRNSQNLFRVGSLVKKFKETGNDDILRLCVVFLHATIEDCLRNVLSYKLKASGDPEMLNQIQFFNNGHKQKIEKIRLGDLAKHKKLSVEELIDLSIDQFVDYQTFNDTNDIIAVFKKFNISWDLITPFLPNLEQLIRRRHEIVHNADFISLRSTANSNLVYLTNEVDGIQPIEVQFVTDALQACSSFLHHTITSFLPPGEGLVLKNV